MRNFARPARERGDSGSNIPICGLYIGCTIMRNGRDNAHGTRINFIV